MRKRPPVQLAVVAVLAGVLTLTVPTAREPARALCAGGSGNRQLPVVFVGIALGKDVEGSTAPYWPHRFRIEELERGLEDAGLEPGNVIAVDLAVNEQFEGGFGMGVEENLGNAPLVGARYRVGAYTSDMPEGRRYHSNGCAGFLQRLADPEGAEPYRQVLPLDDAPSHARIGDVVDREQRSFPGPRHLLAAAAILVIGAATVFARRRRAR